MPIQIAFKPVPRHVKGFILYLIVPLVQMAMALLVVDTVVAGGITLLFWNCPPFRDNPRAFHQWKQPRESLLLNIGNPLVIFSILVRGYFTINLTPLQPAGVMDPAADETLVDDDSDEDSTICPSDDGFITASETIGRARAGHVFRGLEPLALLNTTLDGIFAPPEGAGRNSPSPVSTHDCAITTGAGVLQNQTKSRQGTIIPPRPEPPQEPRSVARPDFSLQSDLTASIQDDPTPPESRVWRPPRTEPTQRYFHSRQDYHFIHQNPFSRHFSTTKPEPRFDQVISNSPLPAERMQPSSPEDQPLLLTWLKRETKSGSDDPIDGKNTRDIPAIPRRRANTTDGIGVKDIDPTFLIGSHASIKFHHPQASPTSSSTSDADAHGDESLGSSSTSQAPSDVSHDLHSGVFVASKAPPINGDQDDDGRSTDSLEERKAELRRSKEALLQEAKTWGVMDEKGCKRFMLFDDDEDVKALKRPDSRRIQRERRRAEQIMFKGGVRRTREIRVYPGKDLHGLNVARFYVNINGHVYGPKVPSGYVRKFGETELEVDLSSVTTDADSSDSPDLSDSSPS
ncbi:MAG: hypothetical protein Q9222_003890 [Ikaeria aurantiellina]